MALKKIAGIRSKQKIAEDQKSGHLAAKIVQYHT